MVIARWITSALLSITMTRKTSITKSVYQLSCIKLINIELSLKFLNHLKNGLKICTFLPLSFQIYCTGICSNYMVIANPTGDTNLQLASADKDNNNNLTDLIVLCSYQIQSRRVHLDRDS